MNVQRKSRLWPRWLALLLALALTAGMMPTALAEGESTDPSGDGNDGGQTDPVVPVQVTSIVVNPASVSLKLGETTSADVTVTLNPSDTTTETFTYTVDRPDVISVTQNGTALTVTAIKEGSARVTVSADKAQTDFAVTVAPGDTVPVTGVTISDPSLSLTVGDSNRLTASVTPSDATNPAINWSSNNPDVVSVDSQGKVTAHKKGNAVITAASAEDSRFYASCAVSVSEKDTTVPVTGVTLNQTSAGLTVGGSTLSLKATLNPANATNQAVTWSSSNTGVATISSNGLSCTVTPKAAGTSTIRVTTADGSKTAECVVTVAAAPAAKVPVTGISLNAPSGSIAVGGTYQITPTVNPHNATDKNLTWVSNNTNVATVSPSTGAGAVTVTGKGVGTATITATAQDGSGKYATFTITVEGLTLDKKTLSLQSGGTGAVLTVSTTAANAGDVSWVTNNSAVISLSSKTGKTCTVTPLTTGTATITVTATIGGKAYTDTCVVTVTGPTAGDITLYTAKNEAVNLDVDQFQQACRALTGRDLQYVTFTIPSSSYGTLCYDYDNGSYSSAASSSTRYYYQSSPYLSTVWFVPKSGYTGRVTIPYTGADAKGGLYSGKLIINVGNASSSVSYSVSRNGKVNLTNTGFTNYSRSETGYDFEYINFTLPSPSYGILYYNYDSGTSEQRVSANTSYYRDGSPYLRNITFVPATGYTGTVQIPFTGRDQKGNSLSGTMKITVGKSSSSSREIRYTTPVNTPVYLENQDFTDLCRTETGSNFNYVTFSLPNSSRGVLYQSYQSGGSNTKASSNTRYYRSSNPRLDDIVFVPASNYTGTVTVSFTCYDTNQRSFTGQLKIYVGTSAADITYSANAGAPVKLVASDFNTYCRDQTGANLDYLRFTLPSKGDFYYNYTSASQYDRKLTNSTNCYRNTNGSNPTLNNITFVPGNNVAGDVSIPFSGYNVNGDSFSGTLVITYKATAPGTAGAIRYTTTGAPVVFRPADFNTVCNARGGGAFSSATFTAPSANTGKLYTSYTSMTQNGGQINPNTAYYPNSSPSLGSITFVPKAGYSGTAIIHYVGRDTAGATYNGTVEIVVSVPVASATFTDVGSSYSWAAPSVDFLYNLGVVTGTDATHFAPAKPITRGDFVLMLYRAFHLNAAGTSSFPDVSSGSYYAEAIAAAKAMGITTGGADGNFNPTEALTRQDAMLLLQRALNASGWSMADGPSSVLSGFSDNASVASYARGAVAALVQAGVIKGDGAGRLNPGSSLTRAEMATILHRVLTL